MKKMLTFLFLFVISASLLCSCATKQEDVNSEEVTTRSVEETNETEKVAEVENSGGVYLTDFVDMTINDVASIWGEDYTYSNDWFLGALKNVYYEDDRMPYSITFLDDLNCGYGTGKESVQTLDYLACKNNDITMIAPDIPVDLTYPDLKERGYTGDFCDAVSDGDEIHCLDVDGRTVASYFTFHYTEDCQIDFSWLEGTDPYSSPADYISLYFSKNNVGTSQTVKQSEPIKPNTDVDNDVDDDGTLYPLNNHGKFTTIMGAQFDVPDGFYEYENKAACRGLGMHRYDFRNDTYDMEISVVEFAGAAAPATSLEDDYYHFVEDNPTVTYSVLRDDFYVVSGICDGEVYYEKEICNGKFGADDATLFDIYFDYPAYPEANKLKCDEILTNFLQSFKTD